MRTLLIFLPAFMLSTVSFAHDLCQRDVIQNAIQSAKASNEALKYSKISKTKVPRPGRKSLATVLQKIETSVFGRKLFRIQEDLPMIPPMATINDAGIITISPQTVDSLNKRLTTPPNGAAFIIAHEMAHFVQDLAFKKSPKKLSPHGLRYATADSGHDYHPVHAETDCIAVEILHQAGYPLNEDLFKTLQIIREECKTQRDAEFCDSADEVRKKTVESYLKEYSPSRKSEASSPPAPKTQQSRSAQ